MAKLTSFNDFVNGDDSEYNQPKPYIYVMRYIISKDDYVEELKEYIRNYEDDESIYEDDMSYDPFMRKLKYLVEEDDIDKIEDMVLSYESYSDSMFDFNEEDDDFEEKMYGTDIDESEEEISDELKDFLKIEEVDFEKDSYNTEELFDEIEKEIFEDVEDYDIEELDLELDDIDIEYEPREIETNMEIIEEDIIDVTPEETLQEIFDSELDEFPKELLDKLSVFLHTRDGKPLTEQQLKEFLKLFKEEFKDKINKKEDTDEIEGSEPQD